jgi:hypothetical protein
MNYSNSDMSKSTNMVVYFDWKMVIYIYTCGHNLCCQIPADDISSTCTFSTESQSHAPTHVLMKLYPIDKSLICLQSERGTSC